MPAPSLLAPGASFLHDLRRPLGPVPCPRTWQLDLLTQPCCASLARSLQEKQRKRGEGGFKGARRVSWMYPQETQLSAGLLVQETGHMAASQPDCTGA